MSDLDVMTPGTYLRRRREAAGFGVIQAAASLAALPWALRRAGADERSQLAARINAAEADTLPFSRDHAELLRNVFAFDVDVYFALLARAAGGERPTLPLPGLCRVCACSWYDPCPSGCAWSEEPGLVTHGLCTSCEEWASEGLCSRCERRTLDPVVRACTDSACPLAVRAPQELAA